ncbi:MAG: 4Fe-4S double cluster binding domain-containing protein [Eubacteriales bacterium]|nr:4Fe-4S double cluster binding domain-containing protein [Eubacteriales bacterium]
MNWNEFEQIALQKGFACAYSVAPETFARWEKIALAQPDPRWSGLRAEPKAIMPQARCIAVLAWAYRPYSAFPEGEAELDAYYPASQTAYAEANSLAQLLRDAGHRADAAAPLPAKRALLRTGEARYGRNGLLALGELGTRICIQTILTDAAFPQTDKMPEIEIDGRCGDCALCRNACPVGAILPGARIDTAKCLRAQPYAEPVPEEYRARIGRSVLGCDICQRICPRNAAVETTQPPAEVSEALKLEKLLAGDTKDLARLIGSNYARPVRMQARAALIAANLGRRDLLPQLEALCESKFDHVREHARWAVQKLK